MTQTTEQRAATLLQSRLDYATLQIAVARKSADEAHAALLKLRLATLFCEPVKAPPFATDPDPIWHALRQPPTMRVGLLSGFG